MWDAISKFVEGGQLPIRAWGLMARSMEERPFGFGVIGCGNISTAHAGAITKAEGAELVAVADILEDKAKACAERYGAKAWYTDYQELLKRDDIDAVCICTPSGIHSEVAVAVAGAGKHMLCEKPLDISIPAMDRMVEAARKKNVKLAGVFQRRTYASSMKIREAVANGELGKMVLADAILKHYRSQAYYDSAGWRGTWALDGGGALMNQGVHGIDLVQWIMGDVESVFAKVGTLARNIEVEDTALAIVTYKSGAYGVIEGATSVYPNVPFRLNFHGELGTITLQDQSIIKWEVLGEGAKDPGLAEESAGALNDPRDISATGHLYHILDLMAAVREDREPFVNGEEAKKAVEVILAIYESSKCGKEIRIKDLR
jgi:UDP-N-acetyl-2-amino-2-deoxyglucuronate dehydrogenase